MQNLPKDFAVLHHETNYPPAGSLSHDAAGSLCTIFHETNYPPEDWKIGRLEDWKIGRFCSAGSLSHDAAGDFSFLNVDIENIYIQEKKSHRILMHRTPLWKVLYEVQ
jgi:hypothetical protein